ncbi:hypothetical protein EMPS_11302 [Entomortierella parvispora]|uniref:CBS domain-containing protein n=1 Tax=Entomortierella parvispora TaxID=205924 RepID=A0A9P3HLY8_9FUNG|nr:hypothetical protein EMPS_11302 [Entomortierella parvispora]
MLRGNPNYQRSTAGGGSTAGTPNTKRNSGVPSPSSQQQPQILEAGLSASELARKRQVRKDDAIRKKLDQELGRKKPSTRAHGSTRPVQGTVGSLRPSPALTLLDSAMIVDAARIMAAKRADAVLVIDRDSNLVGIMTDKDLAFRVVSEGLDIRSTLISQVMTKNPFCVTTETNATEALNKMVNGGFRHLPCLNADGDVVGLLDITKCLYEALEKLEKAHQSSQIIADAFHGLQSEWSQSTNPDLQNIVDAMRERMASPDLNTILDQQHGVAEIQSKTSVREASRIMKQQHSTACLITEEGRVTGIFTTKDIVVRVLAAGLEPDRTSVIRVMTPHPDTVPSTMTILEALKKMHVNHYLHLPVVDDQDQMAGLVDVLQVSFAMLNQMNSIQGENVSASEGPVWNKFWESSFTREETGSEVSASEYRSGGGGGGIPGSASEMQFGASLIGSGVRLSSALGVGILDQVAAAFTFKFKEQSGQVHRFASSSTSFTELHDRIMEKLGITEANDGSNVVLSYCDEENDQVLILQDSDVVDAVQMAMRHQWPLIRLTVTVSTKGQIASKSSSPPNSNAASVKDDQTPAVKEPVKEESVVATPIKSVTNSGIGGLNLAGLDPTLVVGGIGLGLGLGIALVFALMKK